MNKEKEIEKIKQCVSDLVYDKIQLKKAYNYYHCVRDAEQFKHLEDNYGIGTPTSVTFTPLIKKHIDVLVGEYLELDPDMQISCKDDKTISNIMRDKQLKIDEECFNFFKSELENTIINTFLGDGKSSVPDPFFDKKIEEIKSSVSKGYVSDYEKAAQNILNYIKNSRDIDLKNKMRELLTDLLIGGICYYRVKSTNGKNLDLKILNPLDTFIERNRNEFYLNRSSRAVIRRWMNVDEILNEFGDDLSSEAKAQLTGHKAENYNNSTTSVYVRAVNREFLETNNGIVSTPRISPGILGGLEVCPLPPSVNEDSYMYQQRPLIQVFECEWIEYDEKHERLTRHSGVKIGGEIYIPYGEDENIVRSVSNPDKCTLTVNGMFFNDKNGHPFSLMMNTMSLQDRYDLLLYYRDNLIASSGTVGDWIDLAHLPTVLGDELPERLAKWIAYKKNGTALFDSSQEGANILNTTFNGFDDTVKQQAIQAIQIAIESVELQASSITGVFQEKLGGIQERDAVSNVKVGIRQSTLLTKQYFNAMDLMNREVNYDLLNLAKIVYKKGFTGTLVLGNRLNKIFTALPEHYTMTDFDIHIKDSTEVFEVKQTLVSSAVELIKAQQATPTMIVDMAMAKNLTELRDCVEQAIADQKSENDQLGQMQQQLQQYEQQIKQYEQQLKQSQNEIEKLQKQVQKNNEEQLALDKKRVQIEEQEVRDKKDYNDKIAAEKKRQVDIEWLQLRDGNPYNDKIKDV